MPPNATRRRRSKAKGVGFTIMVVGASGTGRTTFVNTLCESEVLPHKDCNNPETAALETSISIKPVNVDIEEEGMRINLTIVDTPGFGDNVNNDLAFQEIVNYLERQYDDILAEQSRIKRDPRFRDNRVHCLLYFIPPTGHHLREIDVNLMQKLSHRVNVIPVIGRSDSLTLSELKAFKKRIMEDILHYDIPVYNFPYDVEEDDEDTVQENQELRSLLPFAVMGSEEEIQIDGEYVRARVYPWGTAIVDDPEHSDFSRLKGAILGSHLYDLKSLTEDVLYETYRTEKLTRNAGPYLESRESTMLPAEDLANQSVRLKEEQLRKEEEKLREIELRVQREIHEKRQQLLAKEESLRNLESRLAAQGSDSMLGSPMF
ncbi:GTP binding protein [Lentinula raphanica]|uniref:GTP binding protein n=1 Tax=Lentinula raphanica TaxID=153919 RepID=A0AA38P7G2_9AGAR|nr:GTP binding protein [Lentinula raphanica]KAJ3774075.1 GTP binding protein [Lentinula raphanica]KAJ3821745.1 GTP binding protein [Lentinula raphanica]KAJ3837566.1 GTP binding protein [Lentinula raphanica]KAJ3968781.1 GTP binding protein [Lentinula raphanica]